MRMKKKIYVSSDANEDLAAIKKYITEELSNPKATSNTVMKIIESIKLLESNPNMGALLSSVINIDTSYRFVVSGNYLAFYQVKEDGVFVVRVLYGRRDYLKIFFENESIE